MDENPFTYLSTGNHAQQSHAHPHFIYIVQSNKSATLLVVGALKSNAPKIFIDCMHISPSFIILYLVVPKLSCWQTNKKKHKQADLVENIHTAPLSYTGGERSAIDEWHSRSSELLIHMYLIVLTSYWWPAVATSVSCTTFQLIPIFAVYMTARDLEKSFNFNNTRKMIPQNTKQKWTAATMYWIHVIKRCTFHSIVCQDDFFSSAPCAAIIEKSVWPELLRTAGLWSTQRSLRRPYSSIQSASNAGIPSSAPDGIVHHWTGCASATPAPAFDTLSPPSWPPAAGRSVHMRDRFWEK